MIGWALGKLGGLVLRVASSAFLRRAVGFLAQASDNEHRVVMKEIDAEIEARKGAREIRLATAGFPEMRLITFLIALPFVMHLWLVALDTMFGLFREWCYVVGTARRCGIPAFPDPFNEWQGLILLSFFGVQAGVFAVRSIASAIMWRKG